MAKFNLAKFFSESVNFILKKNPNSSNMRQRKTLQASFRSLFNAAKSNNPASVNENGRNSLNFYKQHPHEISKNLSELSAILHDMAAEKAKDAESRTAFIAEQLKDLGRNLPDNEREKLFLHFGYTKSNIPPRAEENQHQHNGIAGTPLHTGSDELENHFSSSHDSLVRTRQADNSFLYSLDNRPLFIDHGTHITMANGASYNEKAILLALQLGKEKFGDAITLTGSDAFKERAIRVIIKHNITVKLNDMEQHALWEKTLKSYNETAKNKDDNNTESTSDTPPSNNGSAAPPPSENSSSSESPESMQTNKPSPEEKEPKAADFLKIAVSAWATTQASLALHWVNSIQEQQNIKKATDDYSTKETQLLFNDKNTWVAPDHKAITPNMIDIPYSSAKAANAGAIVLSSLKSDDMFQTSMILAQGDGRYLQGFVRLAGLTHQVVAPLNADPNSTSPLKLYAMNSGEDGVALSQIGISQILKSAKENKMLWNINGQKLTTTLTPQGKATFTSMFTDQVQNAKQQAEMITSKAKQVSEKLSGQMQDASPSSNPQKKNQQELIKHIALKMGGM